MSRNIYLIPLHLNITTLAFTSVKALMTLSSVQLCSSSTFYRLSHLPLTLPCRHALLIESLANHAIYKIVQDQSPSLILAMNYFPTHYLALKIDV